MASGTSVNVRTHQLHIIWADLCREETAHLHPAAARVGQEGPLLVRVQGVGF